MRTNIRERIILEADYMIKNSSNIRDMVSVFKSSKSTIHKDLTERLKLIDKTRYGEIRKILDKHLEVRHIKGGEATRKKYSSLLHF